MIKIYKYGEVPNSEIFARENPTANVSDIVSAIIDNVKENGDKAVFEYCEKFDKATLKTLEVSEAEIEEAFASVDEAVAAAVARAKVSGLPLFSLGSLYMYAEVTDALHALGVL